MFTSSLHNLLVNIRFNNFFRTINDTLGECGRPKIGWQIDPFGHSREMASIFSQMGYDGLFFSRLDWREKSTRLLSKTPEMLWQGSQNLGMITLSERLIKQMAHVHTKSIII